MTDEPTDEQRLVFPVGQFGGEIREPGSDRTWFTVRRGHDLSTLEPEPGRLWLAAHGRLEDPDATAPTRQSLRPSQPAAFDLLLGLGLLVEAEADKPSAVEFARTHRFIPRGHGNGNTAVEPGQFRAGFPPDLVAGFSWFLWRLWRESQLESTLWDGCRALAVREECVREELDERALLTETLFGLHILLGLRLAYLDVARLPEDSGA